jgi:hypothetical protein
VDTEAEDATLLVAATKQRSEDRDGGHLSVTVIYKVLCVLKCPVNPIINPNLAISQSIHVIG